jgi:zinc transport system permease protein
VSAFLQYDFLQRALAAAVLVGFAAPLVGVFLVQRRLALLGDGMGHVALTGIGLSILVGTAPLPTAMVAAACGAIIVEVIRARSRTAGDLALALVFYGGIAGGVVLASLSDSPQNLTRYLFGSITTVSPGDLVGLVGLVLFIALALASAGHSIWLMSLDPEVARVQGVRVVATSALLTVLAAVVVVVGMRVVGILLVSALMIVPVAAAQQLTNSFRMTLIGGVIIGVFSATVGLGAAYKFDIAPGGTIVMVASAVFVLCSMVAIPLRRRANVRSQAVIR